MPAKATTFERTDQTSIQAQKPPRLIRRLKVAKSRLIEMLEEPATATLEEIMKARGRYGQLVPRFLSAIISADPKARLQSTLIEGDRDDQIAESISCESHHAR